MQLESVSLHEFSSGFRKGERITPEKPFREKSLSVSSIEISRFFSAISEQQQVRTNECYRIDCAGRPSDIESIVLTLKGNDREGGKTEKDLM